MFSLFASAKHDCCNALSVNDFLSRTILLGSDFFLLEFGSVCYSRVKNGACKIENCPYLVLKVTGTLSI